MYRPDDATVGPHPPVPAVPVPDLRRGCAGCRTQVRGCALLSAALAALLLVVWIVSLFVPLPFVAFLTPFPYIRQYTWVIHPGQAHVLAAAWSPDGTRVASVADNRSVQVWNAVTGRTLFSYQTPAVRSTIPLLWSPDGKSLAVADSASAVVVLDGITGRSLFSAPGAGTASIAWAPDSRRIAAIDASLQVRIWDVASGTTLATFPAVSSDEVAWSPNGRYLASSSQSGRVQTWDVVTGTLTLDAHPSDKIAVASDLAWSPDSTRLAAQLDALSDVRVQVWEVATARQIFADVLPKNRVNRLVIAWSPDSTRLAIGGALGGAVGVWDVVARRQLVTYNGHGVAKWIYNRGGSSARPPAVVALRWSPDGRWIASAGSEQTVQVWDATTGRTRFVYDTASGRNGWFGGPYSTDGVAALAWASDGRRIVLAGDRFAEVWKPQ
ncbi:MAG: hypothetical protein PVSMB4_11210 [Ktedonobacterales bacterium]